MIASHIYAHNVLCCLTEHSLNTLSLSGSDTREVVYMSYLPDIPINRNYATQQMEHFLQNIPPPAYCDWKAGIVVGDRDYEVNSLSSREKKLLMLE